MHTSASASTAQVSAVRLSLSIRALTPTDDAQLSRWAGVRSVPDAARSLAWLAEHRTLPDGRAVNGMLIADHDQYGDEVHNRHEPDPSRWQFDVVPW